MQGFVTAWALAAAVVLMPVYWFSSFGRGRTAVRISLLAAAGLCACAGMPDTRWVAHVGAGIAVWGCAWSFFGRWHRVRDRLLVSVIAALVFGAMGAHWVLWPLAGLTIARFMGVCGGSDSRTESCHGRSRHPKGHQQRHEHSHSTAQGSARPRPVDLGKRPVTKQPAAEQTATAPLTELIADSLVPAPARSLLVTLLERAEPALLHLRTQGRGSGSEALRLEQIRDDYAPTAVRAYLALPAWSANTAVLVDGLTGAELLERQLQLLLAQVDEVRDALSTDAGPLLAHQRFLQDLFGEKSPHLTL